MATAKSPTKRKPAPQLKPKTDTKTAPPARYISLKKSNFSKNQLIAFVLVFAAIGGYLLFRSFAAAPVVASLQAESMGGTGNVANLAVSSASGGSVKRILANTSISGDVILPNAATSLSVIARGSTCNKWWPWVAVSVDGTNVMKATKVGTTRFKSYAANAVITAGKHNVVVTASNDSVTSSGCQRHLDVDVITFFGALGTTTPPTAPAPTPTPTPTPPTPNPPLGSAATTITTLPYNCNGPVNNVHIVGTWHTSLGGLVNLNSGCTGSLSFDIVVDTAGGDGVKVKAGAHDLSIGPSTIVCDPAPQNAHEDGVQVEGGSNVTFHGLNVVCPSVNGQGAGAFYVNGANFGPITNVICDGCNLEHTHGGVTFNQSSAYPHPVNSGARNSILHEPHPYLDYTAATAGPGAGFLNQNNTIAPACTTLDNC